MWSAKTAPPMAAGIANAALRVFVVANGHRNEPGAVQPAHHRLCVDDDGRDCAGLAEDYFAEAVRATRKSFVGSPTRIPDKVNEVRPISSRIDVRPGGS